MSFQVSIAPLSGCKPALAKVRRQVQELQEVVRDTEHAVQDKLHWTRSTVTTCTLDISHWTCALHIEHLHAHAPSRVESVIARHETTAGYGIV